MDLSHMKYIILELIPTSQKKETGQIVQLSALKLDGIKLMDRFDYRISIEKIEQPDFIDMCSYDKELFTYLETTEDILEKFQEWIADLPLFIIDNAYTQSYLQDIPNSKYSIFEYLEIENNDDSIQNMISKYHLEPSNYIVDLIYEAFIQKID